jgi:hypothetical protein
VGYLKSFLKLEIGLSLSVQKISTKQLKGSVQMYTKEVYKCTQRKCTNVHKGSLQMYTKEVYKCTQRKCPNVHKGN